MATQIFQPPSGSPAWFHERVMRSQGGIFTEMVHLTPSLANELLKNNESNRHVSSLIVGQYATDMRAGNWSLNGEPIIISRDGKLNDGQHRCLAVIDANATIDVLMVFGVSRDSRTTVNQGKKRTVGDYAAMNGRPNAILATTIARMALAYERSDGQNLHQVKYLTSAEILAREMEDTLIAEAATYAGSHAKRCKKYVGASAVGFCFYILSRVDRQAARDFMDKVCGGEGLKRNDPAYTARDRLLSEGKQRDKKVALILRAWTFYRRGRSVGATSLPATLPFPAVF